MKSTLIICGTILASAAFLAVPRLVTSSVRTAGDKVAQGTQAVASTIDNAIDAQAKSQGEALASAMRPEFDKIAAGLSQPQQPLTLVVRVARDGEVAVVPNK